MAELDSSRAYLQDTGVYSHLVETLLTLLDEKPASPLDAFESVSSCTKDGDAAPKKPVDPVTLERAKEILELLVPPVEKDEEGNDVEKPKNEGLADIRDLLRDADLLEKAGVGLGKSETWRVVCALKALGDDAEFAVSSVRFFGKIFGTKADYLVAEVVPGAAGEPAELSEEDVKAGVVPADAPGVGCNKFEYYVSNQAGASWTKLPDVTPAQIMAARQIKKLLTGDLAAPIQGYPVFPGNEANYLRAQISQIAAAVGIVPKGIYSGPWDEEEYEAPGAGTEDAYPDPELTDLTEGEEFTRPDSLVPLTDATGWVHESRALLTGQGRTSWYTQPEPEAPEDAGDDWAPPAQPQPEAGSQGLGSLSADGSVASGPAWSFRSVCNGLDNSEAAVVKSLAWPGACTVADLNGIKGYYWASVYVGNGASFEGASFSPPLPPPVAEEAADPEEATDPTVEEEAAANAPAEEEGGEE